jgi:hypothetical protein
MVALYLIFPPATNPDYEVEGLSLTKILSYDVYQAILHLRFLKILVLNLTFAEYD